MTDNEIQVFQFEGQMDPRSAIRGGSMSTWTDEKHEQARIDANTDVADPIYGIQWDLNLALDEIERLRAENERLRALTNEWDLPKDD